MKTKAKVEAAVQDKSGIAWQKGPWVLIPGTPGKRVRVTFKRDTSPQMVGTELHGWMNLGADAFVLRSDDGKRTSVIDRETVLSIEEIGDEVVAAAIQPKTEDNDGSSKPDRAD